MAKRNRPDPEKAFLKRTNSRYVDVGVIALARAKLCALIERDVPPLREEDAVGVLVFALRCRLVQYMAPEKNALWDSLSARAESSALEIVYRAAPDVLLAAGVTTPGGQSETVEEALSSWWTRWCVETLNPMHATAEAVSPGVSTREVRIRAIVDRIGDGFLGSEEDLVGDILAGKNMARGEAGLESLRAQEADASEILADFVIACGQRPEDGRRYYVDRSGRVRVSKRAVRDHLRAEATEAARQAKEVPVGVGEREALDVVGEALELQEIQDALSATQAVMNAKAPAGSLYELVLSRMDVICGTTSSASFAREIEKPERTVRDAVVRVRRDFRDDLRSRGITLPA